ncbi:recQ-mediated genome instability protein 1-like [Phymastichus coffea]|uniref:recQ-mediated genome instability protein 1-like n=1 Tax=Phymastichus coffea TaxID=108790 RepID=UPI00273C1095|nr:recQ-mediated genome instability protein 1-like [Phymastichus coffea]
MNEDLLQRVKSSLNRQYYTMNHSWLSDCVDYYTSQHENPRQDEITAFVILQWNLNDMREVNNENGCLPRNLINQKCITLPGKYILQVDKLYDISLSKYKQLEKIRNVSLENIEATENENKMQDDKFQTWEPKSKRMLQLFMTDGVQDILGIEYKSIRFLNEFKEPGFKVLIKGPVICRKGVLLLEEKNIEEKGGEVESLLVPNALENVLARALNLEENKDPYNNKNKPNQNTEGTQKTVQIDDDFDFDSQALDQIDTHIQQKNINACKNSATSNWNNKQSQSCLSDLNYSYQTPSISNQTQNSNISSVRNQRLNSTSALNNQKNNKMQQKDNEKMIVDFDDEGDLFLKMVDGSEFKTPSVTIASTVQGKVNVKKTLSSKSKKDEFPVDNEIYDLTYSHSSFFSSSKSKSQSTVTKISSQKKDLPSNTTSSPKYIYNQKQLDRESSSSKTKSKDNSSVALSSRNTSKMASQNKNNIISTPLISDIDNLEHDLDLNDIDFDGFDDYYNADTKHVKNSKPTQASASISHITKDKSAFSQDSPLKFNTNSLASTDETFYENEFPEDFYERCKKKLLTTQKLSQDTIKSLPKSNKNQSVTTCISQVNKPSSAKLSDRLKLDNKNKDYYNTTNKLEEKTCRSSQASIGSFFKSENIDRTTKHPVFQTDKTSIKTKVESQHLYENLDATFENDFDIEFEARKELDHKPFAQQMQEKTLTLDKDHNFENSTITSQNSENCNLDPLIGSKRSASLMSPSVNNRQKLRCLEITPKDNTSSRKITDFFNKPKPELLNDYLPLYEAICDVLENSRKTDRIRTVVRGKVINIVKLNLLKNEHGSYFHLDGTITDSTANLDVVFCSDVLEEIVGYSVNEFILKRKQAKADPKIKDELRDDLKKAQSTLRVMDTLMEIEVKKDEKAMIIGIRPLSKSEKNRIDERLQRHKAEKNIHK